jgi:hypothetical protein
MLLLLITRFLDVFTTYLNTKKWGIGVEGNPFMLVLMERNLFWIYQGIMFLVIVLIAELLPKYRKIIYVSLSILSLMVAISNLFCYLII